MDLDVQLTRHPIVPVRMADAAPGGLAGAWVEFTGAVRGEENGRPIVALEYEAYEKMAVRVIRRILTELGERHPCPAVRVIHRTGIIPVGEAAIWVGVASAHRQAALELIGEFMNELKRDVPIWKRRPIHAGEPAASAVLTPCVSTPTPATAGAND